MLKDDHIMLEQELLFASNIDGSSPTPLLKRSSVATMTTPSAANPRYARGWRVNGKGNWWHTGHLPGTSGLMVRTHSHFCWAVLLNTRHRGDDLDRDLDHLMWSVVGKVKGWRA